MMVLITSLDHPHYDRVGEIVAKFEGKWEVKIPNKDGSITTFVNEGDFKPIKENKWNTKL